MQLKELDLEQIKSKQFWKDQYYMYVCSVYFVGSCRRFAF